MKTQKLEGKSIPLRSMDAYASTVCNSAGLIVFVVLTGFFLLMKSLGLHEILSLRYFNAAFLLGGLLIALAQYARKSPEGKIEYFTGIKMGMRITLIAVIPFAIFMGFYLTIDESFMTYLKHNAIFGSYLSPMVAATAVAVEGVVSGFIITFIVMPYFKEK